MVDIVIIGGGIIGTSIAANLRHVDSVTIFEKETLGSGTTAASMARQNWYTDNPLYLHLQRISWETYKPLITDGTIEYDKCGIFYVANSEAELAAFKQKASILERYGIDHTVIERDAAHRYGLITEDIAGGLHIPKTGYMNQQDAVEHFANHARNFGVTIETGVEVTDIQTTYNQVRGVETTAGHFPADIVLNAAGPWAPEINELAGVNLPLRHTPGPILVLDANEPLDLPYISGIENDFYFRPEGSTKMLAGRRWGRYDQATLLNPDENMEIEHSFREDVSRITGNYIPALAEASVVNEWFGLRTVTPDFYPVIGPTELNGLYVACGMSGSGVSIAPAIGQLLASYIANQHSSLANVLSPRRFQSMSVL